MNVTPEFLAIGAIWYVVFLLSTTVHEASHALAATLGGDLTAFHGGQVSLNPLPHLRREPFGMVLMPILSYVSGGWMMGWASAPYDPAWQEKHPRRAAWMALAGPGANFALALLAGIAIRVLMLTGSLVAPDSAGLDHVAVAAAPSAAEGIAKFLSLLFSLNVLLGTFNLLPIPPLDGYSALGLFVSENGARRLARFRQSARNFAFIGLLIGWQVFGYLYDPIFGTAISALYPGLYR